MATAKRILLFPAVLVLVSAAAALTARGLGTERDGQEDDPYEHLKIGRIALERGQRLEAYEQFQGALIHAPGSEAVLEHLLDLAAEDPDARTLWTHAWYAAASDAGGRARPGGKARELLAEDDPHPAKIAIARARAAAELFEFAEQRQKEGDRSPEEYLVASFARCLAFELSQDVPALAAASRKENSPELEVPFTIYLPVVQALREVMTEALAAQHAGEAVRAARCLKGIGVQGEFKDLKGSRPKNIGTVRSAGESGLGKARALLRRQVGKPWTVDELGWLTGEEGEAFTRDHGSFSLPGTAVSPNELYRIETDCGYETLLGVAETVERHHHRLVNWFGRDPFEGRQGLIRIVPEASGLEAEGAPFWWVGGFQEGDTTVVRLSCGTIEGLGHTITHELTHRFDSAIYPGIPAWLLEGRAVWTGGAYGHSREKTFVPDHADFGTLVGQLNKGYGDPRKLTQLIEGKVEDYQENYGAGYALWVYLSSWEEEGRRIYAERLETYMRGCAKRGRNPKDWFIRNFADGKDGRPDGMEAFTEAFQKFLRGFTGELEPWTKNYTRNVPHSGRQPYVYDEPTWTWARVRVEPFFGQEQAFEAGKCLLDAGDESQAVRAFVWALSADGRTRAVERMLAETLAKLRRRDAAWVMRHALAFPLGAVNEKAPFINLLRQTRIYIQALEEAAADYGARGLLFSAAAMLADRNRLAAWLGMPELPPPAEPAGEMLHPFDRTPRHAGLAGWEEADLVGYEEHRRPDLWYTSENGDLHIGRKKPRSATGGVDRSADLHHVFVRGNTWLLPGTYRVRTRIKFTTAYVSGAVVLGFARRDLNLRFQFSAGDLGYATGATEEEPAFDALTWSLSGLRARDGALPGSAESGAYSFERAMPAFDLELLIGGASVQVFINGHRAGTYHTADGTPIEGYIGFAGSHGSYVAQKPRIQRLDRSAHSGLPSRLALGLDLASREGPSFKELVNLPVRGLPASANGKLLIWIPMPWLEEGESIDPNDVLSKARAAVAKIKELMERKRSPQPCLVAIPAALGGERIRAFQEEMQNTYPSPPQIVTHLYPASIATPDPITPDLNQRWFLFVDSADIIRVILPLAGLMLDRDFENNLLHWLTVFRDHGRPDRVLPRYTRTIEEEEIEDDPSR